ncbi:hypothetical protein AQ490_19270 [Wenjunlia vitaminophila]|uniref:Peptidase S8/S53 domain-containing protein n=1 Tax=Wenjunlia vitaminophila TaxID=76728 RepID=A0A0T6LUJ4_WENVI|nr:hypothetical protein AQ490_19270 [Wenjunlia vitaminophila]
MTLITGDRVTLTTENGSKGLTIEPGEGRKDVGFVRSVTGDRVTVLPSDALALVRQGRLDERLFDVQGLVAMGYDDASRSTLPLIVGYAQGTAGSQARAALDTGRSGPELRSIRGQAVAPAKVRAEDFWASVTEDGTTARARGSAGQRTLAPGVSRIWLDGVVRADLDRSVNQIKAPQAWSSGLTGKGVRVAVLDTGIDAEHPDLTDAVSDSRDFTGNPAGVADGSGHGTHVASIITGSGAAADGTYVGVAPDAQLLVGKVLTDDGWGTESQIIAGMQWAADSGADVVNMSLGAGPTDGTDPMAQAVNALTASSDTLFVVAAGNDGMPQAVSTPASADAALAVGAVDRDGVLAGFSNRGPRVRDHAVKPEITAPGTGIVAARAQGTERGEPVGEHYTALSGTSMATPHVAGAAAILAQQHPDWSADQLKAALTSSAEPHAGNDVFEQGTGLVDVARAVGQPAHASPSTVSTVLPWSQSTPATRTVTYHNDGDTPLSLDLALDVTDDQGNAAPVYALDGTSVTVPAHGTLQVPLTTRPDAVTPGTTYRGTLTARGADGTVIRTALSLLAQRETYPVTLDVIDRAGNHDGGYGYLLVDVEHAESIPFEERDGAFVGDAPPGTYSLLVFSYSGGSVTLISEEVTVGKAPLTLTADARRGVPVTTTVDSAAARPTVRHIGVSETMNNGSLVENTAYAFDDQPLYAVPSTAPVTSRPFTFLYLATLADPLDTPGRRLYNLAFAHDDAVPATPRFTAHDKDLAQVRARYHSAEPGTGSRNNLVSFRGSGFSSGGFYDVAAPGEATEYFTPGPDFTWDHRSSSLPGWFGGSPPRTYAAGGRYVENWNAAAFSPWVETARCADMLVAHVYPASPSGRGNVGGTDRADTTSHLTLLRDGQEVAASDDPSGYLVAEKLPDASARYALKLDYRHGAPSFPLSTRVATEWGFSSAKGDCDAELSLLNVKLDGAFRLDNSAPANSSFPLTLTGEHQTTSDPVALTGATVQASFDDGRTWTAVPTEQTRNGAFRAVVPAPCGEQQTGFVSLRTTARDGQGNTVSQEVIRAYKVR